ncbi:MAG: excinuclease ABC subunit UvrC [Desulfuromonadaceae bacterium]|nr:excinuclease ABC subunit UvrC [Desulfuromonadaceae bacterium]MDD5104119.1 excinuclease ABC subunit UvrC [Desulfuromonadaceae bacterium]
MILEEKIRQFPTSPGVYLMRDVAGEIIYVGKARSLRQRVRSYFNQSGDSRYHITFLMAKVTDIEIMLTDTEKEALLLENTLIKQHRPRYNLNLKDDKTYFSLRVDPREEFPRFTVVRKRPVDGARYFGPYVSGAAARNMLRQMTRMFPLRHYPLGTCMSRARPCLYHQIGQCSAPCHGLISKEAYTVLVHGAMLFMEGKGGLLIAEFKRRMLAASEEMLYEEAARWRNLLRSIEITVEKQKVVLHGGDCDVIGFYRNGNRIELALLFIRAGVLSGSRLFSLEWQLDDATAISAFLQQYYPTAPCIAEEILLPLNIEDTDTLADLFSELKGSRVSLATPQRGTKRELVALAGKNALAACQEREQKNTTATAVLEELAERLQLSRLPQRIECYDISTIQGRFSVGSRAVMTFGQVDRKSYRHYRIRTVSGQDDFAMLREVFLRRFRREISENEGLPDLVVVDGGVGQLRAVQEIIAELGLAGSFDLVSLAKSRVAHDAAAQTVDKSAERVFLPGRKNPVVLRQNSKPLLMLAALRDEAHRFAISYHRKLRSSEGIASGIDAIPGIGAKRRAALLKHFGSLRRLAEANHAEIAAVKGVNRTVADAIFKELHP